MTEYTNLAGDDEVADIASSDWRQRQLAIKHLFQQPDPRHVVPALEQLGSEVPWLRHDAGVALVNLAVRLPPSALASHTAALAEKLHHDDPAVRRCCALALVLVDPAHGATLLRTANGSRKSVQALELAFESDLVQPLKALPIRRLVAEAIVALLACGLFFAAIVWLSTRPASPHHAYRTPCPYHCRAGRPPLDAWLSSSTASSSSSRPPTRPSQPGRRLEEAIEEEAALSDDGDWSAEDAESAAIVGAFGLGWRVWPWALALAVVCFGALTLVSRYRKAKSLWIQSKRTSSIAAAPVVRVSATARTSTIVTTTSVVEELRRAPEVIGRLEPLRFEAEALELPPSQVVRSLLEPGVALVHHALFASHMPRHAFPRFPREAHGLLAMERVAHMLADRLTRAYCFDEPILSIAPQPSPLFAVPAVHWFCPPAEVAGRRYSDMVFLCAGAVPIGTQRLDPARDYKRQDGGQVPAIELNTSGDYTVQASQERTDDLILLGHPDNCHFGRMRFCNKLNGPEPASHPRPAATVEVIIGPAYASHVGESWRVDITTNPVSQLLRELDSALPERSQLTILAPPHIVARLTAGLQLPPGTLSHVAAEARAATIESLARGCDESNQPVDFSAATHVLILEAEAAEAVALSKAAPETRVVASRGGRFYLSEEHSGSDFLSDEHSGRDFVARALADYTLPHPRIFGPEAEHQLLGLMAHIFACGPRADGSWEFAINHEAGGTPPECISVKPASDFAWPEEEMSFSDIVARVRMQGEAAIGYIPATSGDVVWPYLEKHEGQTELLLTRDRVWLAGDRIVVIGWPIETAN